MKSIRLIRFSLRRALNKSFLNTFSTPLFMYTKPSSLPTRNIIIIIKSVSETSTMHILSMPPGCIYLSNISTCPRARCWMKPWFSVESSRTNNANTTHRHVLWIRVFYTHTHTHFYTLTCTAWTGSTIA